MKDEEELYSTDEEDIEKGILKLIEDLERAIQDDSKPHDERRRYLKKVPIFVTNWWHFEVDHGFNWIFRFIKTDGNSQRSKERREK